jgi:hypothetical protein
MASSSSTMSTSMAWFLVAGFWGAHPFARFGDYPFFRFFALRP